MNEIYFLTGNENKLKEVKEFVPEIKGLNVDVTEIQSISAEEIIKHKLNEAKKQHSGKFVVEDTSLYLDCLNGLPGPLIKWFLKTIGNEGLVRLAKFHNNDKAIAKCIVGFSDGEKLNFFEGSINGKIVEKKGENGFGWDKIFQPDGYEKTFAEMTTEEKNKISHRRLAFEKLREYLNK